MALCGYTIRQIRTFFSLGIINFGVAACFCLQAPFYPREAESKGASATQYGLVLGIFQLVVFLVCPPYGKRVHRVGHKNMIITGTVITGVSIILFGLLDNVNNTNSFIALSIVLRVVEALGYAAVPVVSNTIVAKEFPENTAATFAAVEVFFGCGLIVGPTIGGAFYDAGGYPLPFMVWGCVLLVTSVLTILTLPSQEYELVEELREPTIFSALKVPSIVMFCCSVFITAASLGFLQATLEPHVRKFGLSSLQTGFMFILEGSAYALTSPIWGWLCDNLLSPGLVTVFGAILITVSWLLVGPAPILNMNMSIPLCAGSLILFGVGIGAQMVSGYSGIIRQAVTNGFPDDLATYGLVSGLRVSAFSLGCFFGPSIGGILADTIGFRWGTVVVASSNFLVATVAILHIWNTRRLYNLVLHRKNSNLEAVRIISEKKCKGYGSI